MGLRERNAAHTRESITDAAVALFVERGYDATTMEEIALGAAVSPSTLYRYFPSKDLLVIEPFALHGQMATELRGRPAGEALDLALGHALRALLMTPRAATARLRELADVLQSTPSLQARMLEEFDRERRQLAQAVAERTGRSADDPFCVLTARLATTVIEIVGMPVGEIQAPDNETAARHAVEELATVLAALALDPPVLPRLTLT